jgi:two-component system sensor histidine kinase SenX3
VTAAHVDHVTAPAVTLLDFPPTATVLIESSGSVRLANTTAREMGLVGRRSLAVPELRQLVRDARRLHECRQTQVSIVPEGFPHRTLAAGARAEPLSNGDVVLVVIDLTEANRVESVRRDFVANVGHEIKTPVGALTLLIEAALLAQDDPETARRFLDRLHAEAQRLSRLVQDLLDLSRLQGGEPLPKPAVVRLDSVIDEAVDRTRLAAERRRIALVRSGREDVCVRGSEIQLVTALANLLENAIAYSSDGSQVYIRVGVCAGVVELSIADQGIGIPADQIGRIFERFYRVDPARSRATGGTGLGLSIVKHVVSNHGGEVGVASVLGEGSTFSVRLPACADGADIDAAP